jgi:hypothetical protein
MAKYVKQQPTVAEKIDAVTPYEREWSMADKKHHR